MTRRLVTHSFDCSAKFRERQVNIGRYRKISRAERTRPMAIWRPRAALLHRSRLKRNRPTVVAEVWSAMKYPKRSQYKHAKQKKYSVPKLHLKRHRIRRYSRSRLETDTESGFVVAGGFGHHLIDDLVSEGEPHPRAIVEGARRNAS